MADEEEAVPMPAWNDASNEGPGPFNEAGVPHGQGTMTYPNKPAAEDDEEAPPDVFVGHMADGRRTGRGTYTWGPGTTYTGDYVDGVRHGHGEMAFASGDKYSGAFANGNFHGKGKMAYRNGDVYVGDFENGTRHGSGCYHFKQFACQFVGTFEGGKFMRGRWVFQDGSSCEGSFESVDGGVQPVGDAVCVFAQGKLKQQGRFENGNWIGVEPAVEVQ